MPQRRRALVLSTGLCAAAFFLAAAAAVPLAGRPAQPAFRTALAEDPDPLGVGRLVPDLELRDLDGKTQRLSEALKDRRAVVLFMTSATCPLSIKYGPRLTSIAAEYEPKGVASFLVNVADTDTPRDMQRQARSINWRGPYLPDRDRSLRRALAPRTTTEVYVIDRGRTVVFRGAVDDQHGIGASLAAPRNAFLTDALDALLAERRITTPATWPPGCVLGQDAPAPFLGTEVTYHNRISRIVQARCADCHTRGRVAPFPLDTYESIAGRAPMIEAVIREGIMPPWHASSPEAGQPSPWRNDLSLSASEKRDLLAWLSAGLPVGNSADAPAPRELAPGWTLGMPDLLLISPALDLPADGPMAYAAQVIDTGLCEGTWVSAIEFLPRRPDSVHHALLYLVPPAPAGAETAPPEAHDPAANLIAVYGPGFSTVEYPRGAGLRLPAGARLLLHTYSVPMGTPHRANLRIGFTFAKERPAHEVRTAAAYAPGLRVPANTADHAAEATYTLPTAVRITAFMPSLRARGRAVRYDAVLPDGSELRLLDVPRYDFAWRVRYELAEPLLLPEGTVIRCRAVYDNTRANPHNSDPDAEPRAGWTPEDEILLGSFEYLLPAG